MAPAPTLSRGDHGRLSARRGNDWSFRAMCSRKRSQATDTAPWHISRRAERRGCTRLGQSKARTHGRRSGTVSNPLGVSARCDADRG
jgi:hypothetical protein